MLCHRYLSSKDAFFVEDVLTDINEFQDKQDTYRVLLFPPLSSYQRLLIHKTVESDFPNLITFSIGSQDARRTVVAFREACRRGEKGRELLARPPESHSDSQKTSKWNNQSSSERVAHWVKQREARRLNKERWAKTTADSFDGTEGCNSVNEEVSPESETGLQGINRAKSKKNTSVPVYVPPFLRHKKTEEMEDEIASHSAQETESSSSSGTGKCADSSEATSPVKRKNETQNLQGKKDVTTPDQKTRKGMGRGMGRGRKKPEMEVYVPRALREARQEPKLKANGDKADKKVEEKKEECSNVNKDGSPQKDGVNVNSVNIETGDALNESHKQSEPSTCSSLPQAESVNANPPLNISNCSHSNNLHNMIQQSTDSSQMDVTEPLVIDPAVTNVSNDPLAFEFYDPAIVAFMPSPKAAEDNESDLSGAEGVAPTQHSSELDGQGKGTMAGGLMPDSTPLSYSQGDDSTNSNSNNFSSHIKDDKVQLQITPSGNSASNSRADEDYSSKDEGKGKSSLSDLSHGVDNQSKKKDSGCSPEVKSTAQIDSKEECKSRVDDEGEEDSWDALFDDNGDCLDNSLMEELTNHVGKVEIDKPKINYLNYTPKEPDLDMRAFGHIVEIYDFSPNLATHDLITAFKDFSSRGFDIKWVDDTHALGVFSSTVAANEALKMMHPMFKVRSMSEASKKGQGKAKHCSEFLQPYKARPETTSIAARRLVAGALGMTAQVPREVRDQERKKLKEAKEKRRRDRQQKSDMWDGSFGKCAMDEGGNDGR